MKLGLEKLPFDIFSVLGICLFFSACSTPTPKVAQPRTFASVIESDAQFSKELLALPDASPEIKLIGFVVDRQGASASFRYLQKSQWIQSSWVPEGKMFGPYSFEYLDTHLNLAVIKKGSQLFKVSLNKSKVLSASDTALRELLQEAEAHHKNVILGAREPSLGNYYEHDFLDKNAKESFSLENQKTKVFLAQDVHGYEYVGITHLDGDRQMLDWEQKHWRAPQTLSAQFKEARLVLPISLQSNLASIQAYSVYRSGGEYYFISRKDNKLQEPIKLEQKK